MSTYTPDRWVMLKISMPSEPKPVFKILAGWKGGWCGSDSWKLSSGTIDAVREEGSSNPVIRFGQCSGSEYTCYTQSYGLNMYTQSILDGWLKEAEDSEGRIKVEVMPENFSLDQDWLK